MATYNEAHIHQGRGCRSGGCALKAVELTSGDLLRVANSRLRLSAYNRGGVIHRFVNTTDVLATVEEILGLDKLSKFDYYGRPLREIFTDTPDLTPYVALKSEQPLNEMNPETGPNAQASIELDLDRVDAADEDAFNRILWNTLKGQQPYPGTKRMSVLEVARAR